MATWTATFSLPQTMDSSRTEPVSSLAVAEFFSGIGGLHYALRRVGLPHRVVQSFDVDDVAVKAYSHNLGEHATMSSIDLCSLRVEQLRALRANMWLLSPPCQPYSRQGLQLGGADKRAGALVHMIGVLERCPADVLPLYVLLENVVGFESSGMRQQLHQTLTGRGYSIRELWASPAQFGVPNQRTRYFLLARRTSHGVTPTAAASESVGATVTSADTESTAAKPAGAAAEPTAAEPASAEPAAAEPVAAAAAACPLLSDFAAAPAPIAPLLLSPAVLRETFERGEQLATPKGEVSAEVQQACDPLQVTGWVCKG